MIESKYVNLKQKQKTTQNKTEHKKQDKKESKYVNLAKAQFEP